MKIIEVIKTLKAQKNFERTSVGRSITPKALEFIQAVLDDKKNYELSAVKCTNCNLICSSILPTKGCVNCGAINLTTNIDKGEII